MMRQIIPVIIFLSTLYTTFLYAQDRRDIESVSMAVERMLDQNGKSSILKFIDQYMGPEKDLDSNIENIREIRNELKGLRENVGLDLGEAGAILSFSTGDNEKRLRIKYNKNRKQITDLFILPPDKNKLKFSLDNPEAVIQYMEAQNMAGLLSQTEKL